MSTEPCLDPAQAPDGYHAVLKSDIRTTENFCRSCDWRPECQKRDVDLDPKHRCSSYAVTYPVTGEVIQRADGCSVVFKKGIP